MVPFPFRAVRFVSNIKIVATETFRREFVEEIHFVARKRGWAKVLSKLDQVPIILEMARPFSLLCMRAFDQIVNFTVNRAIIHGDQSSTDHWSSSASQT